MGPKSATALFARSACMGVFLSVVVWDLGSLKIVRGSHKLRTAMARPCLHPKIFRFFDLAANKGPKMGPNLDIINRDFRNQVGLHFGGVLAAMWRHRTLFWRPKRHPGSPEQRA